MDEDASKKHPCAVFDRDRQRGDSHLECGSCCEYPECGIGNVRRRIYARSFQTRNNIKAGEIVVNIIVELSKYLMILLMGIYTFSCFSIFAHNYESEQKWILIRQNVLMFLLQLTAYVVMYLKKDDPKILTLYAASAGFLLAVILLYRILYPKVSKLIVNNMCMLLCIGMIMLTRLEEENAIKQLIFAAVGVVIGLVVPVVIRKLDRLKDWGYMYAGAGILALVLVAVLAEVSGGAKLGFTIAGFGIQPSEFVKILFVFFVAANLNHSLEFKNIVITTALAAAHVLILVLSTDLGTALILFVVYLVMLYTATRQPLYVAAGLGGGSVAAVLAYHLFAHIQVRVAAWKDPFATYSDGGYQVAQSLFAIGTGSWFGMGLFQGLPDEIPVADTDFIFAAISEEMGLILSLCLILVCVSCYVMFLNIALALRNQFYKLVALGLGTCYIFQVFLNIGGVTKFIPSTGVTLPLVSYGGSSILSTMIMFGIIQGLYILREDEEENLERKRERELRNGTKRRTTKKKKTTKEPGFEEVPKQRVR